MTKREHDVVYTYRYLRAAMVALLLMMLLAVGFQWLAQLHDTGRSCVLGSISAYYYTPARTIFVGSLCALGVALIAYRGHTSEQETLLNFSGFMALVVAMVPTVPDNRCGPSGFALSASEIATSVQNNIAVLIAVTVMAALVAGFIRNSARRRRGPVATTTRPPASTVRISVICAGVLLTEFTLFIMLPARFIAVSHGVAAATMVAGVIAVMVFSALQSEERHRGSDSQGLPYRRIYGVLATTLGLLLAATVTYALSVGGHHSVVLIAEVIVIVLFCAYWIVQTKELWNLHEAAARSGSLTYGEHGGCGKDTVEVTGGTKVPVS